MMTNTFTIIHYIPGMSDSIEITIIIVCQVQELCALVEQARCIQVITSRWRVAPVEVKDDMVKRFGDCIKQDN